MTNLNTFVLEATQTCIIDCWRSNDGYLILRKFKYNSGNEPTSSRIAISIDAQKSLLQVLKTPVPPSQYQALSANSAGNVDRGEEG